MINVRDFLVWHKPQYIQYKTACANNFSCDVCVTRSILSALCVILFCVTCDLGVTWCLRKKRPRGKGRGEDIIGVQYRDLNFSHIAWCRPPSRGTFFCNFGFLFFFVLSGGTAQVCPHVLCFYMLFIQTHDWWSIKKKSKKVK